MQQIHVVYTESGTGTAVAHGARGEAPSLEGGLRFVTAAGAAEVVASLAERGGLIVSVPTQGTRRGELAERFEECIEAALRARGASAAGFGADGDEDGRLSDQLFRARRVGFTGLVLDIGPLRALCAPVGGLDAADARSLAFHARASEERPLVLVLSEADRDVPAFVVTRPLDFVLQGAEAEPTPTPAPELASEPAVTPEPEPVVEPASISLAMLVAAPPAIVAEEAEAEAETASASETATETASASASEPATATAIEWRGYAQALHAARGPQTLAAFERLFAQSYLPLAAAIDAGLDEHRAIAVREEFRRTFARAYSEALPTFALTGKRPRMVLDAFDAAAKMARAHGARAVQMLLVDGMRFDLAARVAELAAEQLQGRASLADRVTLFSAVPSTTPRQLEGLARGIEALRAPYDAEREQEPMRGRTAEAVRRMRVGSRDLYKLDIVETTLAAAGDGAVDTLAELAFDTAHVIAKHARQQKARTLLFVFGDHGFRFEAGEARQGGASPEEVIVSGHGFLIGELH